MPQFDISILAPLLAAPCALLHPTHQKAFMARLMGAAKNGAADPASSSPAVSAEGDSSTCILPVIGVLTRYGTGDDRCDAWYGICAMLPLLDKVNQAAADPMIQTIVFDVDSPGGFVDGTCELADAIAAAAKVKNVIAVVRGLACSGAYWLVSQCDQIIARPESQIGNIGVYSVLMDMSKWWAQMGVDLELVATGPYKGLGADGKITDALREETQRTIDGIYGLFTAAVSAGRGMSIEDAQAIADGRAYLGNQAKKFDLIDAVATSFSQALSLQSTSNSEEETEMSKQVTAAAAAAAPAVIPPAAAANVAPGDAAAVAAAAAAAESSSSSAKSAFTKCTSSANDHRDQARMAMDAAGSMTDDPDDDTKQAAQDCVSALESAADESNRAAEKITQQCKLDDEDGGDDDDGGDDNQGENARAKRVNRAVKFKAKDFAVFGDAGYRMYHEGKSFVTAAGEALTALRNENTELKKQLAAAPRGNPAAAFQAELSPAAAAAGATALPPKKSDGVYSDGSKYGDGRGLDRYEAGIKLPTSVTAAGK
jgi:signal peptide peptidase SppA